MKTLVLFVLFSSLSAFAQVFSPAITGESHYTPGSNYTLTISLADADAGDQAMEFVVKNVPYEWMHDGTGAENVTQSPAPFSAGVNGVLNPGQLGEYGFGYLVLAPAFPTIPGAADSVSITFAVPDDFNEDDVDISIDVKRGPTSGSLDTFTASPASFVVTPPPGPDFSQETVELNSDGAVTSTDELADGPDDGSGVDLTIVADGSNEVTFSVRMDPSDGAQIERAAFLISYASRINGFWEDDGPIASTPSFADLDGNGTGGELNAFTDKVEEGDIIEFGITQPVSVPVTLNVLPDENGATTKLDHLIDWSPVAALPANGAGVYSVTWRPPEGLVTKDIHGNLGRVFYLDIGGIQSNKGEDAFGWVIRVLPKNNKPVANADDHDGGANAAYEVLEDSPNVAEQTTTFDPLSNDTDLDTKDTLTLTEINGTAIAPGGSVNIVGGGTTTIVSMINGGADHGKLMFDPNGQFDSLAVGDTATVSFNYTVSDGVVADDQQATVTITIIGVNDEPTFLGSPFTNAVPENTTVVRTVTGDDLDAGDIDEFTFSLTGDGIQDNALFDIDPSTGELVFSSAPDFEDVNSDNNHTVEVNINDGHSDVTQLFTVTVTDVDDLSEFAADAGQYDNDVPENSTAVMTVVATDQDGAVVFAIEDSNDGDLFQISATGELSFITAPNFENPQADAGGNTYTVVVEAADADGSPATRTVTVNVTDVNETPTLTAPAQVPNVVIDAQATILINLNDVDAGDQWDLIKGNIVINNYSIGTGGDGPNDIKAVPGSNAGELLVTVGADVAEQTGVTFETFEVTVTDNGDPGTGNNPITVGPVTITVNVIENDPPAPSEENKDYPATPDGESVDEDDSVTVSLIFDDTRTESRSTDDDGIARVEYRIFRNGTDVGATFLTEYPAVVENTATDKTGPFFSSFTFKPSLDFMFFGLADTIVIRATAIPAASGASQNSVDFSINVNDVNRPPTIDSIADPAEILEDAVEQTVALSGLSHGDNKPVGRDDAQSYSISVETDNADLFSALDHNENDANDDEDDTITYTPAPNKSGSALITVTITDNTGAANAEVQQSFTVEVKAVNDIPTIAVIPDLQDDDVGAINEDLGTQTVQLDVAVGGDDAEQTLTVRAESSDTNLIPHPTVDQTSFKLTFASNPHAFGTATITVYVNDDGGTEDGGEDTAAPRAFLVTVNPVNDAPVAASASGFAKVNSVAEREIELNGTDVDTGSDSSNDALALTFEFSVVADPDNFDNVDLVGGGSLTTPEGGILTYVAASLDDSNPADVDLNVSYDGSGTSGFRGVETFYYRVRDEAGGVSDVKAIRVTVGTPLWYPFITWSEPSAPDSDSLWYNVKVRESSAQRTANDVVFETNVNGTELTVVEYFLAGFTGFVPGDYDVEVGIWDPIADTVTTHGEVAPDTASISVAYDPAEKPVQTKSFVGTDGTYTLTFIVGGARGYDIRILGNDQDIAYVREIRQIFRPVGDVVSLNQEETLDIELPGGDEYFLYIRGFNPLDEANGRLDPDAFDDLSAFTAFDSSIDLTADAGACSTPGEPLNLLPKKGDLITLPVGDGGTQPSEIERTFTWDPVAGATAYYVYLSASSAAPILNFENVGTSTNVTRSLPEGTYTWMVVAQNDCANDQFGPWSTPQQFTVAAAIAGPVVTGLTYDENTEEVSLQVANGAGPNKVAVLYYSDDEGLGEWMDLGTKDVTGGVIQDLDSIMPLTPGPNYFRIRAISVDDSQAPPVETPGPSMLFSVDGPAAATDPTR